MPLNRPALSLGPGPRGVQDSRRWITETLEDMGRADLVECTVLALSEVVTNALLHGQPPVQVRVRGTREHPRVEVRDASPEPPVLPAPPTDTDTDTDELDLLLTFGRGLQLVARASTAWGADLERDGKVVWFMPAVDFSDDDGPDGVITTLHESPEPTPLVNPIDVHLLDVPVADYQEFQRHVAELRREVHLLALAQEARYPIARTLAGLFDTLGRPATLGVGHPAFDAAVAAGRTSVDLTVTISRDNSGDVGKFAEVLDLTDAFCREERMLSLARTEDQRRFQTWFLTEFVEQAHGAAPTPWQASTSAAHRVS